MKILGIETATAVCAAAVVEHGSVCSEHSLNTPHVHSEKLIALIDRTLGTIGMGIESLDGIAISIGPGSFTGLRIGLSVAKGLAYAHSKPLLAVPTLKALASNTLRCQQAKPGELILSMIDARRDEVFSAGYRATGSNLDEIMETRLRSLEEVYQQVRNESRVIVSGDGAEKFQQFLMKMKSEDASRFLILPPEQRMCSASAVGLLGEAMLLRREVADTASLEPMYMKDFYTLVKTQHEQVHQ
jgi:tRNA threonylcarbamoyladenosine biosynthesis protein TsaB